MSSSALTLIDISWNDVLFKHILPRLTLKELFFLRATSTAYNECVLSYFAVCPTLILDKTTINSKFNERTFQLITSTENCVIRVLVLSGMSHSLTDSLLLPILERSRHLQCLDLSHCNGVSDTSLMVLADCCHVLEQLSLRDCHWVSSAGVAAVLHQCCHLQQLILTGCWAITDDVIINKSCHRLVSLELENVYGITDVAITALAASSCRLQNLNIRGCWRVTDRALLCLADSCKQLRSLNVMECPHITDIGLLRLRLRGVQISTVKYNNEYRFFLSRVLQNLLNSH